MRSNPVNAGDAGTAAQYDNLRDDAYGGSLLLTHQQTTPGMTLYVEPGTYYIGTTRIIIAGGSTPTFTAPVTYPRIDLVTADSTGTIAIVQGTEASTPVAPAYPSNKVVLCEVYNVVGETALYDLVNEVSGQGYISNDVRPFVKPTYIGSASQVAANLFIPWIASPVQGDIAYFNGTAWARLPIGGTNNILGVSSGAPAWVPSVVTSTSGASSWTTSSTGTQTIAHGLGKVPKLIRITMMSSATSGYGDYWHSVGTYNGSSVATVWMGLGSGGATQTGTDITNIIFYSVQESTTSAQATPAFDATNITLTWSKTGSPANTIPFIWEAIG